MSGISLGLVPPAGVVTDAIKRDVYVDGQSTMNQIDVLTSRAPVRRWAPVRLPSRAQRQGAAGVKVPVSCSVVAPVVVT